MKHELGQMRTQGSGAIVNCSPSVASSGFQAGLPITPPSTVIGLTTSAALEYAPRGSASTPFAPAPSRPRWSPT